MSKVENNDQILNRITNLSWESESVPSRTDALVKLGNPKINLIIEPLSKDPKVREDQIKQMKTIFSPEAVEELIKNEQQVYGWLAQNPQNAIQLIADPISIFEKIGIKLSPYVLSELQMLRQKLITPEVLKALAEVKHLSVKMDI